MKLRQVGAWILILTICLLTGCGQSAEQSSVQTESSDVAKTIGVGVSGDFYPSVTRKMMNSKASRSMSGIV